MIAAGIRARPDVLPGRRRARAVRAGVIEGRRTIPSVWESRRPIEAGRSGRPLAVRTDSQGSERRPPQGGVMKSMRRLMAGTVAIAGLSLGLAAPAAAQASKAGVVTS